MIQKKRQTFNDGVVAICEVINISDPGNMPKDGLKQKEVLRFDRRTVGITRFYEGKQGNVEIEQVVRCQRRENVSTQDKAVIGEKQYNIVQVQYPKDVIPPVMDLSLERLEQKYEFGNG